MSLDAKIKSSIVLPAVCAPMMLVSGPALVREACKAGIMAALPRHNARSSEEFAQWLASIRADLNRHAAEHPDALIGPLAVNLTGGQSSDVLRSDLEICAQYGVEVIISVMGNPAELTKIVHDWGGKVFHDVTNLRFASKAIEAGVDGVTCIGSGGGGHSGTLSALAFIPRVREMWDGTIIFAGNISTGSAIRAAEILGADLAYLGTRFIATRESEADERYKSFLVSEAAADLLYTDRVSGVAANWLKASLKHVGLDPDNLPISPGFRRYEHLPEHVRPWRDIWSAGQGIELIHDIPTVAELVYRLRMEYVAACETPSMLATARLVDQALESNDVLP
jgi:nitronate monooxygenase